MPDEFRPYGSTCADAHPRLCGARIERVEPASPADAAGLSVGMVVTHVEGVPLRDLIEWRWQADGFDVELTLDDSSVVYLERELGQDWGIVFDDCVFDGVITCRNACSFCFMSMLPPQMRPTLYLRDDDYRLSFLQGNFVTLTNVDDDELERIIECHLSPLHVSLHAVSPDVRETLMGKNAARGMEVLEALLDAGLEVHVQVVVVPGVNDGVELMRTLAWIERHPGVLSAGFVPLGYTRHQERFSSSFSDDPDAAAAVIELIREFQEDSGVERRNPRLQIADEFYIDAGYDFPPAFMYAGYPQFQDGIGMMRAFIDEWSQCGDMVKRAAAHLEGRPAAHIVCGTAFARVLRPLVEDSPLSAHLEVLAVENGFFGGNVDVTCLLTGHDLIPALIEAKPEGPVLLAREMFNQDFVLLDDVALSDVEAATGATMRLCTYDPADILEALML